MAKKEKTKKEKKKNWIKIEMWTSTGDKIKLEGPSCPEVNVAIIDAISESSKKLQKTS